MITKDKIIIVQFGVFCTIVGISTVLGQRSIVKLAENCQVSKHKEEAMRYKALWKRECEAYKDLAIRTGHWDVEEA